MMELVNIWSRRTVILILLVPFLIFWIICMVISSIWLSMMDWFTKEEISLEAALIGTLDVLHSNFEKDD